MWAFAKLHMYLGGKGGYPSGVVFINKHNECFGSKSNSLKTPVPSPLVLFCALFTITLKLS